MAKLTSDELLFLDTLSECGHSHVSDTHLKTSLAALGINEEKYMRIKMKLLFARYIGSIYGNVTLEKKNYRELTAVP